VQTLAIVELVMLFDYQQPPSSSHTTTILLPKTPIGGAQHNLYSINHVLLAIAMKEPQLNKTSTTKPYRK
jgi:hypothetical protein